jgi:hypothetical protein
MGLIYFFFWPEVIHLRPPRILSKRGRKIPLGLRAKTKRLMLMRVMAGPNKPERKTSNLDESEGRR